MESRDVYNLFLGKYKNFTEIQTAAFPIVESGKNCLIIAPTGSGKTEAVVLPVLKMLEDITDKKGIQVIYITPLRALNRDLMKRLEWLSEELGISMTVRHGDTPQSERQKQAANPPRLLITTPESLQNLFLSGRLRASLSNLKVVVVDELHELYSNKRGAQLTIAMERLAELAGDYQRIGISATIGNVAEAKTFLGGSGDCAIVESRESKNIEVRIEMPISPQKNREGFAKQFGLDAQSQARIEAIANMVRNSVSTLIFANTRQIVESLGSKLIYFEKLEPFGGIGVHHSSLDKTERVSIENAFKNGAVKSIIATSSLELGIDIGAINLVIQYGSPRQVTRLLQRVGRGGHREKETAYGKIIVANAIEALESLAILLQAKENKTEMPRMEENALDVLINQICAIALENKILDADKIYSMVRRAAPYKSLSKNVFEDALGFAAEQRLVRMNEKKVGMGGRTRDYFYSNISVLPEISRFYVKDSISNKIVATLDEEFVSGYVDEGSVFITKGVPWKVVSIEKDVIFVEQSDDLEAAVPDWEGEDIPVTYATASKVYDLLGGSLEKYGSLLDEQARLSIKNMTERKGFFVPDSGRIVIEELDDYAILYLGLGRLANELIAHMLSYIMSTTAGTRIKARATPYAIVVEYGNARKRPNIEKALETVKKETISNIEVFIADSELFRHKFVQVAKLSGVVKKSAAITRNNAERLINFYRDSPIYRETVRDIEKNRFDTGTVLKFLEEMRTGKILVDVFEGHKSPLGDEILKASYYYREFLLPEMPSETRIKEFERELLGKKVPVLCTYCGFEFDWETINKDKSILCPSCKSPMACIYTDGRKVVLEKKHSDKKMSEKEKTEYNNMIGEASMVESYGNRAILAFSTYGVGLTTAARILKMIRRSYTGLYTDLIEAQKTFIKNKKFWKS